MSENQNRRVGNLSKYDAMTTEELEEILRLDAQALEEQESDTEMILYVMEVLAARKRNNVHTGKTALKAYESFKQNYLLEVDNVKTTRNVPTKITFPRWLRCLTATAAVLAILLVGSVTAQAFGLNIWEAVVKWTQETFHFGEWGNANINNDLPYTSLREALEEGEITTALAPDWFPGGYELVDIKVDIKPLQTAYKAIYTNGEQDLRITVRDYLDEIPVYVEQSDGLVEEYKVAGVTYYLFENNKRTQAVWIVDSYECRITGELTIEELKLMIDSVEKG